MKNITVSALVIQHPSKPALLMVRKKGTTSFMLPGGKPEPDETAQDTVVREIREELGLRLDESQLFFLGTFTAPAANEARHTVTGHVFVCETVPADLNIDAPQCLQEIEDIDWFSYVDLPPDTAGRQFAPLTRTQVIPALVKHWSLGRKEQG
ncbi:8-oxo-dGTP pyrophosphatase MutT (NUDIX family) [Brevibacterium paucivorans]|uniref:8-oxo-dGTP pyrophosphatase MutT (NUDIX family) n=1 Tax=Brevibacterium paucivorans TaxID=170994 RepID=A0ABS2SIC9_9MICO|nr:NUDIX domain-containing protein [Brevibacterium paucivorans]MBM7816007.1 8-oxo-dGTP pyrophosphatase MutT (NUDIX family) [Brevibacterium paucivorans]